ncbi:MAG: hypothetical protein HUU57_07130 [Bdellovibrio sp.]|nr:hypothetical protein [Bdellovibrio sp.]
MGEFSDKYLMLFRVFFLHFMIHFAAIPVVAQLADLYANFSKLTYEAVHGCPQLKSENFNKAAACTLGNSAETVSDLAQINEEIFFAREAQDELQSLGCAIKTTQAVKINAAALNGIAVDMAEKVLLAAPLYSELRKAKLELTRLQSQGSNNLRTLNRNHALQIMVQAENKVAYLEQSLAAITASLWMGSSHTIAKIFMDNVRAGAANKDTLATSLRSDLPVTLTKLRSEFESNRRTLEAQRKGPAKWDLSLQSKRVLLHRAQEQNSFQTQFPDSADLGRGMECRLEGKYGKGQEYVENMFLAGTLIASGGSALIPRAGFALRATVTRGVQMGRVSEQAGGILLKTSLALNASAALADIDKNCRQKQDFVSKRSLCEGDAQELATAELENLEQGNCILAIGLSGAPLPLIAGVGKALRGLKPPGLISSLAYKGDELLSREGTFLKVSPLDISKYSQESEEYLKRVGLQSERITTETLPNFVKNKKIDRLKKLKEQLAKQERSANVLEDKAGGETLQGALFGNSAKNYSGEDGALENILSHAQPLSREENIKLLKKEIAALEKDIRAAPERVMDKPMSVLHDFAADFGVHVDGPVENYSVLKITQLPATKGKALYNTPAILHPEMQKDLEDLRRIGVDVRIDPAMKAFNDEKAFFYDTSQAQARRVINIGATAPYEVFKHEKTHALFSHYIKPKLDDLKKASSEGKSLDSILTEKEMQGFGKENLRNLERNLKRDNTELALNERLAVDAQLSEMGLMRYAPRAVDTEAYGLRHQLEGYQKIYEKNQGLTSAQEKEYLKIVAKAGALLSYQEGAQEAQKVFKTFATPSAQSAEALARKLKNLQDDKEPARPTYFFDPAGRLLVLNADGTWQRFNTK